MSNLPQCAIEFLHFGYSSCQTRHMEFTKGKAGLRDLYYSADFVRDWIVTSIIVDLEGGGSAAAALRFTKLHTCLHA